MKTFDLPSTGNPEDGDDEDMAFHLRLAREGMAGYAVLEDGSIACYLCAVNICACCGTILAFSLDTFLPYCPSEACPEDKWISDWGLCVGRDYRNYSNPAAQESFRHYCLLLTSESSTEH